MTQAKLPFDTDRDPGDEAQPDAGVVSEGLKQFKPWLSEIKRELDDLADEEEIE